MSINSYYFIKLLSDALPADATVVVGTGTSFTCTYQAAKMKIGQRWLSAPGYSAMGYALPASIGAVFATGKKVVCIVGDGDFQFNIQELATIAHHKLPIIIFVLNNGGYLTIKHMQDNHFGRRVGSDDGSGISFPDLIPLSNAYDIHYSCLDDAQDVRLFLDRILDYTGPAICEIAMPPDQPLIPRVQSRKNSDGSVSSGDISDMYPFLDRAEYEENMSVSK